MPYRLFQFPGCVPLPSVPTLVLGRLTDSCLASSKTFDDRFVKRPVGFAGMPRSGIVSLFLGHGNGKHIGREAIMAPL